MNSDFAIMWDFDGTIVDSTKKNMAVTIEVLNNFIPNIYSNLPAALANIENYVKANHKYKNWRDLYKNCYGLSEEQVNSAGRLWSPYQLQNSVVPDLFMNLAEVIAQFKNIPQGICSQNCATNIKQTLSIFHLSDFFQSIIGYEDIDNFQQKPNPAGMLKCLQSMSLDVQNSTIIYIGDHQEDVNFAKNTQIILNQRGVAIDIKSIAVSYSGSNPEQWATKPDFIAQAPADIATIITTNFDLTRFGIFTSSFESVNLDRDT